MPDPYGYLGIKMGSAGQPAGLAVNGDLYVTTVIFKDTVTGKLYQLSVVDGNPTYQEVVL